MRSWRKNFLRFSAHNETIQKKTSDFDETFIDGKSVPKNSPAEVEPAKVDFFYLKKKKLKIVAYVNLKNKMKTSFPRWKIEKFSISISNSCNIRQERLIKISAAEMTFFCAPYVRKKNFS